LPISPIASHHHPVTMALDEEERSDIADTDELGSSVQTKPENASVSGTSTQSKLENGFDGITIDETEDETMVNTVEDQDMDDFGHRSKRRRTEGVAPERHSSFTTSSAARSDPRQQAVTGPMDRYLTARLQPTTGAVSVDTTHVQSQSTLAQRDSEGESECESEGDNAEEYAVETILEHYYDNEGVKYYLVKWEGYEDSHDWLTEEDLQGAVELVAEYNQRIRRKKGKKKI
jgi:hypothetical protein